MTTLRVVYAFARGEFMQEFEKIVEPVAEAATSALRDAATTAVQQGRSNIAGAGNFGPRWQQGLDWTIAPKSGASLRAKATIFHRIGYAGVFEHGATIMGKPLIWLPLPTVPTKGDGQRMRPKEVSQRYGRLASVNRRGRKPLLVGRPRFEGKAVPLFFGVTSVRLRKRFRIGEIVMTAAGRMGEFYLRHIKR